MGEQLNLVCKAKGKPAPKISWIRNGRIIPDKTEWVYHVKEVSVSDAGVYSCRASNQLGSVTSPGFHVLVQCKYFLIWNFDFKQRGNEPCEIAKNFRVLRKCSNKFDCLIFEMFFIRDFKPKLNKQSDSIRAKLFA